MAGQAQQEIGHLFRRAGFGATEEELHNYARLGFLGFTQAATYLLNPDAVPDDVDAYIGLPGYVGITARGPFTPGLDIGHARQRWLFRMVHSRRPLQEKMALFWHNHFATAFSKIQGDSTDEDAARMLAAKPDEDAGGVRGQLELFRQHALGNFHDLLVAVAQDPAMLFWLDGRSNVRSHPQENFARELMELFTMGVGTFQEDDVYAGARVFTGWNLARPGAGSARHYAFSYSAANHETSPKTFSFPIYSDGGRTIPARSASAGLQDGLDLLAAVAGHPATGPRLARKLYAFLINDVDPPDTALIDEVARVYYAQGFEIEPMVRRLILSAQFRDPANYYKRYSWPVEYVARSLREVGWAGFSVNDALSPLVNMGQQLFEPPDVAGWELGRGWFTTGAMLARMNFAAQLTTNQKFSLRDAFHGRAQAPDDLVSIAFNRLTPPDYTAEGRAAFVDYVANGNVWSGSDSQLLVKGAGLVHLILASGEYQFL